MHKQTEPQVHLRPIQPADREPLYAVHRAGMRDYVEATWGWEEDVQRDFWTRTAHDGVQVITHDGMVVGYLDLAHHDDHLDIVNIMLDPAYQGRGIGRAVIGGILDDAFARGLDVRLQVLKVNPRARALYHRLGFEGDGETTTHQQMVRREPK